MTRALILDPSRRFRTELERHLGLAGVQVAHSGHDFDRGLSIVREQDVDLVLVGGQDEPALLRCVQDIGRKARSQPTVIAVSSGAGKALGKVAFANHAALLFARPESQDDFGALAARAAKAIERRGYGRGKVLEARPGNSLPYDLLAIVSSTGGPPALSQLLTELGHDFPLPIALVQHLPAGFDTGLSTNLTRDIGRPVVVAEHGMVLGPKSVVIAPSGSHLEITANAGALVCQIRSGPPEVGCRPSGNRMLRSAAQAVGRRVLGVCLTGMGTDGADGMKAVAARGGYVIAQDEATSVVYGMPAAVVAAGAANQVLPLGRIAETVRFKINRSHHGSKSLKSA